MCTSCVYIRKGAIVSKPTLVLFIRRDFNTRTSKKKQLTQQRRFEEHNYTENKIYKKKTIIFFF